MSKNGDQVRRIEETVSGYVAGQPVRELASMFRLVWSLGAAGVEVPLTVIREGEHVDVYINSVDRNALLYTPPVH